MSGPDVWLIGEVAAPELSPATSWLRCQTRCSTFADAQAAIAVAQRSSPGGPTGDEPDLVIFFRTRPGQIGRASVEAIHQAFPLSRLLVLVGPWCEGEVRSGRPWPGVTRIYWHQWQPRLVEELLRHAQPRVPRLPRSATEVDVLLSRPPIAAARQKALIGVVSRRHINFESLASVLAAAGHHPVWLVPGDSLPVINLDAVVVDGESHAAAAWESLRPVHDRLGSVPAVLLCHFPRPDELAELGQAADAAILAKPYVAMDLLALVADLLAARQAQSAAPASAAA